MERAEASSDVPTIDPARASNMGVLRFGVLSDKWPTIGPESTETKPKIASTAEM